MTYKQDYGQQEATLVAGADPRRWLTTVTAINKNDKGEVVSVDTVKVSWQKTEKGFAPIPVEGSAETLPCDLLLIAMGFVGPETPVMDAFGMERTPRGLPLMATTYRTGKEKVFAAGDMRFGQSLVVRAIREGRQCARSVDEFLMGVSDLPR